MNEPKPEGDVLHYATPAGRTPVARRPMDDYVPHVLFLVCALAAAGSAWVALAQSSLAGLGVFGLVFFGLCAIVLPVITQLRLNAGR